jgi:flagellar hook-associated protein 2
MAVSSTSLLKTLGASSIDTKELTANLINATKEPRQQIIDEEQNKVKLQISNTALLKSALTTLESAATEVGSVGSINQLAINSSDSSVITASKSSGAVAKTGTYAVTVTQLATPQRTVLALPSGFTLGANGALTLSRGLPGDSDYTQVAVNVGAGATPSQIVAAINTAAKSFGVTATLIDTKTGADPLKIVLESATGEGNAFSCATNNAQLTPQPLSTAQNAIVNVNGLTFERSSNAISDAVSGLTLQLNAASVNKEVRLAVSADTASVVSKVQNLVDTYNVIREFLVKATGPKVNGDDVAGSLQNNSTARAILVNLRSTVTAQFTDKPSDITHWSDLGVAFDRDGVLQFNSGKFQVAFENNRESTITALTNDASSPYVFSGQPSGLAGNLAVVAHQLTKATGAVTVMSAGFDTNLKRIDKKQVNLDAYIQRLTAQYEKQFAAMDAILAGFKDTQSQLTRAFDNDSSK